MSHSIIKSISDASHTCIPLAYTCILMIFIINMINMHNVSAVHTTNDHVLIQQHDQSINSQAEVQNKLSRTSMTFNKCKNNDIIVSMLVLWCTTMNNAQNQDNSMMFAKTLYVLIKNVLIILYNINDTLRLHYCDIMNVMYEPLNVNLSREQKFQMCFMKLWCSPLYKKAMEVNHCSTTHFSVAWCKLFL